jgi:hypothetical protein
MTPRDEIANVKICLQAIRGRVKDLPLDMVNAEDEARLRAVETAIASGETACTRAVKLMDEAARLSGMPATVTRSEAPQSSVQIEDRAKGRPAITVKVYGEGAEDARDLAVALYEETVAHFVEAAKVTVAEASS